MLSHHDIRGLSLAALSLMFLSAPVYDALARNKPCKRTKYPEAEVLRQSRLFDVQKNTVSNVEFYTTNYGIFGQDIDKNLGGLFWPRGSRNQYGFGGGVWFGAIKRVDDAFNKLVTISYNPNSGNSWVVPGRIADGDRMKTTAVSTQQYGVYFSTDYNAEGTVTDGSERANWPIWYTRPDEVPGLNGYAGDYIADPGQRSISVHPKGPVMLSDEDIVSIYKDTDTRRYEEGEEKAVQRGYPLRTETVQSVYTWGTGDMKDVVFIQYEITNRSQDTLRECWFAPAMDFDINMPGAQAGGDNDRVRYYSEDPSIDLAVQWTGTSRGETGEGFGYVGMTFLSSPAVDGEGYLRTDKFLYPRSEQLGLVTFRNWVIESDPRDDDSRYNFMSQAVLDGDNGEGDKRFLMATGPFHMLPGQKAKIAVAIVFAHGSKGGESDGTSEDLVGVAELTRKAREKYEQELSSGIVGVREQFSSEEILAIGRVYPNPASTLSHVEFSLGLSSDVVVDVVDVTGRVALSRRQVLPAGTHVVNVRAGDLQPGVYTCRVSAQGVVKNTAISVIR